MDCYIFDLDGTLADLSHRLHHIEATPVRKKDWRAFFAAVVDDAPIAHVIQLARAIKFSTARSYAYRERVIIVSGRSDECREMTEAWLEKHDVPCDALYMRRAGDRRPDDIVKGEILDQVLADGWRPIMAFDDRDRVVAMWRARGIPCAQVAPGNF